MVHARIIYHIGAGLKLGEISSGLASAGEEFGSFRLFSEGRLGSD
jgi:hypothetical protein